MKELSKVINLSPNKIRRMYDLAQGMENVISFVLGEPDFTTPQNIIDAAKRALDDGQTHYTPNAGILPLRQAISKHFREFDKVDYNPEDEILVTAGGMQGLFLTLMVLTNPGDEVLLSDPCYSNYYGMIKMNHSIPISVPVYEKDGFNFNEENLKNAITPKTKAILVNSPANPTGGVATCKNLEMIARVAIENDLFVIYDEVYKNLIYDDAQGFYNIARIPGMRERTVLVDSLSKSYAMTGWRVGFCLGPKEIISHMPKLQEFMVSCVNTVAQYAAIEAFNGPQDACKHMNAQYKVRRDTMVQRINNIEKLSCITPQGAFYVFMNIKETGLTSDEFALRLLQERHVVVAPGDGFGSMGEGYVRLSYATSVENINEGFDRIEKFVRKES